VSAIRRCCGPFVNGPSACEKGGESVEGLLLAVDTSTRLAGIALYDGVAVRGELTWESARHHTVELAPRTVMLLRSLGAAAGDLTGLAVALGPGSFTGLRIGLALVKGLALARGIPVVGIPTLEITAYAQPHRSMPLYAVLQAGRGRIAVGRYRWRRGAWRATGDPFLSTWEKLIEQVEEKAFFSGELDAAGVALLRERLGGGAVIAPPASRLRRAGYLAELAWQRLERGEQDDPTTLVPIYLHEPV